MWLALAALSNAQDAGTTQQAGDLELVRPVFTAGSLPWTGTPHGSSRGGLRVGLFTQFERDPLVLQEYGREVGAVIRNRSVTTLGGSWQPHRHLAVYATFPVVVQWGSELPAFGTDGVSSGDTLVGLQVSGPGTQRLATAVRAELGVPTGRATSFSGDGAPRASLDALVAIGGPYLELTSSLGATGRRRPDRDVAYDAASELRGSGAVHVRPWPGRVELHGGASTRGSFQSMTRLSVAPGTEALAGLRLHPVPHLQADLGMGKGLGYGYGTSEWRVYTGLTWTRIPTPVEEPLPIFEQPVEDVPELQITRLPDEQDEAPLTVVWAEGELARLDGDQIEIRDELHFVFGTAELLPESLPTLEQVSQILNANPDLLHVVIEGHASAEGSHRFNYNLSYARARSVWEALVEAGVHPDRLSTRGMGEVDPGEGSVEANRRVEFHVVARAASDDEVPERALDILLPWSGRAHRLERQRASEEVE